MIFTNASDENNFAKIFIGAIIYFPRARRKTWTKVEKVSETQSKNPAKRAHLLDFCILVC